MTLVDQIAALASRVAAEVQAVRGRTEVVLDDFRAGTDPDWTNAFTAATAWSGTNRAPVQVRPSPTPYETSASIQLGEGAQLLGPHVPHWGTGSEVDAAAVRITPSTTFPADRGLVEVLYTGRSTQLSGVALVGLNRGTNVHGLVFPGVWGVPELGTVLSSLEIAQFSGDGLRGGARVVFLDRLMIHENAGYGWNINEPWFDSRAKWVYSFHNLAGGLNIEDVAGACTFSQCRFERSGMVASAGAQNEADDPDWNPDAPGIRLRSGGGITFVQCDTDANTGAAVDAQVESATPIDRPQSYHFVTCGFMRDGQGDPSAENPTGAGVKVRGYANVGGQNVPLIRFRDCRVTAWASNDDNEAGPSNPQRGVWFENTEFCEWSGGAVDAATTDFYFGGSSDPTTTNWRLNLDLPQKGVSTPAYDAYGDEPALTEGLTRDAAGTLQRYDGSAWQPLATQGYVVANAASVAATTRKFSFDPGYDGGGVNRRWARLVTVDGNNVSGGAHVEFLLAGVGDFGGPTRATMLVNMQQRGADTVAVKAWGWDYANATDPVELYTKQISTYVFELWGEFAIWNQTHLVHILHEAAAGPVTWRGDSISSTAPTGLSSAYTVTDLSSGGGAPTSRTISTTAPLTGGGDLSADRTLGVTVGTTSGTVAGGNDSRFSDTRTPTDGTVTDAKVASGAAIAESKLALASDAAAGTASRRTLGTGATQAAAGTHTHADVPTSRTISTTAPLTGGGDLSANRTLAITTGTTSGTVATGDHTHAEPLVDSPPYTVTYNATISLDASAGNNAKITATGNITTFNAPTNPTDGQMLMVSVLASGGTRTVAITSPIQLTTGMTSPFSIASGKVGFFGLRYSALSGNWTLLAQTVEL